MKRSSKGMKMWNEAVLCPCFTNGTPWAPEACQCLPHQKRARCSYVILHTPLQHQKRPESMCCADPQLRITQSIWRIKLLLPIPPKSHLWPIPMWGTNTRGGYCPPCPSPCPALGSPLSPAPIPCAEPSPEPPLQCCHTGSSKLTRPCNSLLWQQFPALFLKKLNLWIAWVRPQMCEELE